MKKLFASLLAVCAISSHAQPAGFVFLSDSATKGQAFIGNIRTQRLTVNPTVPLAEFTIFYPRTNEFVHLVADCLKPDITFFVDLDANGNKYRSSPVLTPSGTLGFQANVYACTQAFIWPETKPAPAKQRERTLPV
jgi:hypothetical protein